jgi:hypothetical protein
MRKLILAVAAATAFTTAPAMAHPEDEGTLAPRGPSTAELAQAAIEKLVAQKKLPATWTGAKLASFDYRTKNGVDQYVLIFENPSIKQAAKRKLYVLMTTSGEFISANHKLI